MKTQLGALAWMVLAISLLIPPNVATATPIQAETTRVDPTGIEEVLPALSLAAGWEIVQAVVGVRGFAEAKADEVRIFDPTQPLPFDPKKNGLKTKGGWFTTGTEALAAATGARGSKLTTDAKANIGLPTGTAIVTFPMSTATPIIGSYFGLGLALSGFAHDVRPICAPLPCPPTPLGSVSPQGPIPPPPSSPLELRGSYTLNFIDLFVPPGPSGTSTVTFTRDVWVTPDRDLSSLTDEDFNAPSDAIYVQRVADAAVTLHGSGPSGPFLSFEGGVLDAADFTPITLDSDGLFSTHLVGPKTKEVSLTIPIPGNIPVTVFDISTDSAQTQVPEPSTILLLVVGLGVLLGNGLRRRKVKSGLWA